MDVESKKNRSTAMLFPNIRRRMPDLEQNRRKKEPFMFTEKANVICLYKILHDYSDEEHIMQMKDIILKFKQIYDMHIDRRTVYSGIGLLMDVGYDISTYEDNGKGYYLITRSLEPSEIRLLTDAVESLPFISKKQSADLIVKLQDFGSVHTKKKFRHLTELKQDHKTENAEVFYIIETIDDAIDRGRQIAFNYCDYDVDKKLHLRHSSSGDVREYIVNPYRMVSANGRFYLVGNYDKYDNISHYRIDRIKNLKILESKVKPYRDIEDFKPSRHMAEHIYMFSGESVRVKFRAARHIVGDIIDWFGTDVWFTNTTDETVDVSVTVNAEAMKYWLLQFGPYTEVLEPTSLREKVRESVKEMYEKYEEGKK